VEEIIDLQEYIKAHSRDLTVVLLYDYNTKNENEKKVPELFKKFASENKKDSKTHCAIINLEQVDEV